ncbi:hypothetical protein, partial [Neorhizobium galegae]|uniref:hypothetical protein n=1 Tax=Neorhizobium galegae TaxID=399 RepID=UPI0021033514
YGLGYKFGWDQVGKAELGSHGAESPSETVPIESQRSSEMSQTQYSTPKHTDRRPRVAPGETAGFADKAVRHHL